MADASAPSPAAAALGAAKAYNAHPAAKSAATVDSSAEDFEAVFLTQMMEQMFSGLGEEGPLSAGPAGGAYRSMLADQYGKTLAASGGIGLADHVRRELLALQQGS
ncbi:rod-binding protein [Hansschlegelia sp. KR7-227]|jgi:flagellar protein FlgJ|uniref:rod-binding protein n=1 Tax=Hansschlegelia sp. KR7-227 TaxID=3400914 RepID=UPI003C05A61A